MQSYTNEIIKVYGRVTPKESFNSVQMLFRKVHSLVRDLLAVSCTCILWIDLTYLRYPYQFIGFTEPNVAPGCKKAKIYLLM